MNYPNRKAIFMTAHLRLLCGAGVLFLLAAAVTGAQEAKKVSRDFYPMQVGNTWTYKIEVGGNTETAVASIAKVENVNGSPLARLDVSVKGKVVTSEHLVQNAMGIFRHKNKDMEITPPICLLKYPVKAGAKWDGTITVGKETGKYACEATEEKELTAVAAGKFKTMRVAIALESDENGAKKTVNTVYWFAPDVGIVKMTVEAGNLNIAMELQKFEPAKKKE